MPGGSSLPARYVSMSSPSSVLILVTVVAGGGIGAPRSSRASHPGCFDMTAYQNSSTMDSPDIDGQSYQAPSGSSDCPLGYAPRQACVTTDNSDPAHGTGGCSYNEKPFYWTDSNLNDTPQGQAPDANYPVDGMPRNVFATVCTDADGVDQGLPIKEVRASHRFHDGTYLYKVTCSDGTKTLTEY